MKQTRQKLRIWLSRTGLFFLAVILLYAVGRPIQIWLDGFYSGERQPYLQMPTATAMTIRWQSQDKYTGFVRFGTDLNNLKQKQSEKEAAELHEIRLSGLQPATKYYYSAGNENKADYKGRTFWFKTAPAFKSEENNAANNRHQNQSVRFWVTGDQGYPNPIQKQVRDAMFEWLKHNPRRINFLPELDFWITTGDNAYQSGSNKQFQAGFFEPYKNILRNTPVWPVYGNHDARRWVFFDIFSLPKNAESGGIASATEHYYSFDYANIHFVILDTQQSSHKPSGDMLKWLKKDLENNKQQWLISVFHHPPYTKGSHDSDDQYDSSGRLITVRENILPLLEKAGVDVVLSGHSHMYERSALINCHYGLSGSFSTANIRNNSIKSVYKKRAPGLRSNNGTIYSVMGSSSKVDEGPLDHPALPYSYKEAGSMIFEVDNNHLKAYFINKNAEVKDQFEIIKGDEEGVISQSCK